MEEDICALIASYGFQNVYTTFQEILFSNFMYLNRIFQESITCIYGIFRKSDNSCIYIGCSIHLHNRVQWHYHDYDNLSKRKLYKIIRESGGWQKYYFKVLEKIDDTNIMYARESYYIKTLKPIGNSIMPPHIQNNISVIYLPS